MWRKRKALGLGALLWLCMMMCPAALADWKIEMNPTEWTWEAGGVAAFSGVIRSDGGDVSGAVLTLSVETRMEDSGEIVFTSLNDKKIKIRKRSNTTEADLAGGSADNVFEGEWYLPAEVEEGLSGAVVRLTAADAEGKSLFSYEMPVGSVEQDAASDAGSPAQKLDQLLRILLIAGVAVWVLALGRFILLQRPGAKKS